MHPSSTSDNSISRVHCSLFTLRRHRQSEKELGRVREENPNYEPVDPVMCPLPTQHINFIVCGISELSSGWSSLGGLNSSRKAKLSIAVMSAFLPWRLGLGCWPAVGVGDKGFREGNDPLWCSVVPRGFTRFPSHRSPNGTRETCICLSPGLLLLGS